MFRKYRIIRDFKQSNCHKDKKRLRPPYLGDLNRYLLKCKSELLQLYLSTSLFDSLLQVLSLVLRETFLQCRRSAIYEILSLFQTKTASLLNSLYNLELSATNFSENYIK